MEDNSTSVLPSCSPMTRSLWSIASHLCLEEVHPSRDGQWGLLTALSKAAKNRLQNKAKDLPSPVSPDIVLFAHPGSEHILGRSTPELQCQFEAISVSSKHCRIYLSPSVTPASSSAMDVFVQDTSSNGTWINNVKLTKNGPPKRLSHGDILSLVGPPDASIVVSGSQLQGFCFLFRKIPSPGSLLYSSATKRKPESEPHQGMAAEPPTEGKRQRILQQAPGDGPVSLAEFKSLQRANQDLRLQLEKQAEHLESQSQVQQLQKEQQTAMVQNVRSEVEAKWKVALDAINAELAESQDDSRKLRSQLNSLTAEVEDLRQRLSLSVQTKAEAEATIERQLQSISDMEARVVREEKSWLQRLEQCEEEKKEAQRKWQEEVEQERVQHDMAVKALQLEMSAQLDACRTREAEQRTLVDTLRSKLEIEREACMEGKERERKLERQWQEQVDLHKSAQEEVKEGRVRVSQLEELVLEEQHRGAALADSLAREIREKDTALRAWQVEKQRLQGAKERVMLRETQLRAFHTSASQIASLHRQQMEQMQSLIRTLEDDDDDDPGLGDRNTDVHMEEAHAKQSSLNSGHECAMDTQGETQECTPPAMNASNARNGSQEAPINPNGEEVQSICEVALDVGPTQVVRGNEQETGPLDTQVISTSILAGDTQIGGTQIAADVTLQATASAPEIPAIGDYGYAGGETAEKDSSDRGTASLDYNEHGDAIAAMMEIMEPDRGIRGAYAAFQSQESHPSVQDDGEGDGQNEETEEEDNDDTE